MDATQLLRDYARRRGIRAKACTTFYLSPADVATVRVAADYAGRHYEILASRSRIVVTGKRNVPVFFSVSSPGGPLVTTEPLHLSGSTPTVYFCVGFESEVRAWFSKPSNVAAIERLRLRTGESLHVARNETMFVASPDRGVEDTIAALGAFLDASPEQPIGPLPHRLLPASFEDLEDLARKWVISDDQDRKDELEALSPSERKRLTKTLVPRLAAIQAYLSTLGTNDRDSEEASRLGALGELGAELAVSDRGDS